MLEVQGFDLGLGVEEHCFFQGFQPCGQNSIQIVSYVAVTITESLKKKFSIWVSERRI